MSIETNTIASSSGESSFARLAGKVGQALEFHETKIRGDIASGTDSFNAAVRKHPHLEDLLKRLDTTLENPNERKLLQTLKQRVMEVHMSKSDFMSEQINTKSDRVQLELAIKAISKTTSGIQQLLSAQ